MNYRWMLAAMVSACAIIALPQSAHCGEKKADQEKKAQNAEMNEHMAAWMKYASPGVHHEHLKPMAGKWTTLVRHRMSADGSWVESKGTCKSRWILDGRFLLSEVAGEALMEAPFKGLGIMGYDNQKQKYVSVWMDNMGTMIMSSEGICKESGRVFVMEGEYEDPMTGTKKIMRSVGRIISDDNYVDEMYVEGPDGKEFKNLEVIYTRESGQTH